MIHKINLFGKDFPLFCNVRAVQTFADADIDITKPETFGGKQGLRNCAKVVYTLSSEYAKVMHQDFPYDEDWFMGVMQPAMVKDYMKTCAEAINAGFVMTSAEETERDLVLEEIQKKSSQGN